MSDRVFMAEVAVPSAHAGFDLLHIRPRYYKNMKKVNVARKCPPCDFSRRPPSAVRLPIMSGGTCSTPQSHCLWPSVLDSVSQFSSFYAYNRDDA